MDDLTFWSLYSAFGVALIGALLFLLARRLDRQRYLRPVLYGFLFGAGVGFLFGGGIFAFLMGGAVTGYLFSREVGGWWTQFRAGGLNGGLLMLSPFLANSCILFTRGISEIAETIAQNLGRLVAHEEILFSLYGGMFLDVFLLVAIVGMGAVLGGMLRKFLKPAEQKREQTDLDEESTVVKKDSEHS